MKGGFIQNNLYGISSVWKGIKITLKHFFAATNRRKPIYVNDAAYFSQPDGLVTLNYPHEQLPLPDNARYRLHNEIDDCIVCDLCAKICPVDCIDIEPIKSTEVIGQTSDGTNKRIYAAKFDIDMAKCCYCGLCTTVCPTECLTMTKTYDFSEFDIKNMNYVFGEMTAAEAEEKRILLDKQQKEIAAAREAALKAKAETTTPDEAPKPAAPAFKPVFKPVIPPKKKEE